MPSSSRNLILFLSSELVAMAIRKREMEKRNRRAAARTNRCDRDQRTLTSMVHCTKPCKPRQMRHTLSQKSHNPSPCGLPKGFPGCCKRWGHATTTYQCHIGCIASSLCAFRHPRRKYSCKRSIWRSALPLPCRSAHLRKPRRSKLRFSGGIR
ncbi:hypothetical protein D3C71_1227570 [compost metagenome]